MLTKRIIPCLDIKDGQVVKGVNFVGLRDIGDPVDLAKRYEDQSADEVVFLDITASSDGRNIMLGVIERAARELSIPLTVGGGMRTLEDIRTIVGHGADKASINSAALARPDLVSEASAEFGSSTVVVAIDAKKRPEGSWHVFAKGGREDTGRDLIEWATECEARGAGEILLTSMDRDGTREGYDLPMLRAACAAVHIPVIASGGCGSIGDIVELFTRTDSDAALVASLFHYGEATVDEVKGDMRAHNIPTRTVRA